jgi:hypothetical protein
VRYRTARSSFSWRAATATAQPPYAPQSLPARGRPLLQGVVRVPESRSLLQRRCRSQILAKSKLRWFSLFGTINAARRRSAQGDFAPAIAVLEDDVRSRRVRDAGGNSAAGLSRLNAQRSRAGVAQASTPTVAMMTTDVITNETRRSAVI